MKQFLAFLPHTLAVVAIVFSCQANAQEEAPDFDAQQLEFFESKVRPILVERCYECHGPDSSPIEGGLSLASRKAIIAGGDTGAAMEPGDSKNSLIIEAINYSDVYEMPPDTKMPDDEIAILSKWVDMNAPWPAGEDVEVATVEAFDLEARKAEHWAWQRIKKQPIPKVKNESWVKDPIDHFILEKVEAANLKPADEAEKSVLIRRAYFDFVGLPPSPTQVESFIADDSPEAFEKVVDELLASPAFGERWARHWMDLARYAESGGHEFDYNIPYAYRYRDYLIRAFNEDVSYKQIITEHIAGDLVKNPRRHLTEDYNESILATGFWFLGEAKHAAVDSRDEEARTMDNQIDVMSKSFLGMTVACARCHDHKFDAISAEDYYALAGFLQSSRRQDAMMDPQRNIEKKFGQAKALVVKGSQTADEIKKRLKQGNDSDFGKYLDAAIEILRDDQSWLNGGPEIIEGETLKKKSMSAGEGLVQTIEASGNFKWRGDKQYWWKHGKKGDSLELEFQLAEKNTAGRYEIKGVFTTAADYGKATISVNNKALLEQHDFYSVDLGTTGELKLGNVELSRGKNVLKLELNDRNEKAIAADMIGIDYLVLVPPKLEPDQLAVTVQGIAQERKLENAPLSKLVAALVQPEVRQKAHPLHLAFLASQSSRQIDRGFADQLAKQVKNEEERFQKSERESKKFADFENGLPAGWFRTGFAFGDEETRKSSGFSSSGKLFEDQGTVSSGRFGSKFYGVISSPTFELKHGQINYRVRGKGITVRLIVNGFRMDEFNALLYKGCKQDLKPSENFGWQVQHGDIPNHVGQRAHLEIIDHGDGYGVIDEIRFSDGGRVFDAPSAIKKHVAGSFESQSEFSNRLAAAISQELQTEGDEFATTGSWVVDNELTEMFSGADKRLSRNVETDSRFVSSLSKKKTLTELVSDLASTRDQLEKLDETVPAPFFAHAMTEGTGEEERIFIRGNHKTLGKVATRRFLTAISARPLNPPDGSGRLLLANKMTAPNNPLTSRVAVNRLWHHLMGRGIVASVDDFGKLGMKPTHPELLDYLSTEFTADGWSLKRMLKRIALTKTYQMTSATNPTAETVDPDNLLLHRANIRRLQGEAIRDSLLAISGRLDSKMYGPPVAIHLTKFMQGRGRPRKSGPVDGDGRRSIYVAVRRNFLSPMMLTFDTPIPFNAIGKRNQSNVPAQSLILLNDPFVIGEAKRWAEKLVASEGTMESRIETIYATALSRPPSDFEIKQAKQFLQQQAKELGVEGDQVMKQVEVWQDFCHVVFNLKEFIFIN